MRSHPAASPARILALTLALLAASACSKPSSKPDSGASGSAASPAASAPDTAGPPAGDLAAEGRQVYMGNCIACHNPDPNLDGSLGPAIAGSSQELIEARVLHGAYPEGYTPKRSTTNMVPLPYLRDKIPALGAYLSQAGSSAGS